PTCSPSRCRTTGTATWRARSARPSSGSRRSSSGPPEAAGSMAILTGRASQEVQPRRLHSRLLASERGLGHLLLLPTVLVLGVFLAYPFFFGLWLSLSSAELTDLGHFIGLANFKFEFTVDHPFLDALRNTFLYTGVTTVFKLVLGLGMALLLNQ